MNEAPRAAGAVGGAASQLIERVLEATVDAVLVVDAQGAITLANSTAIRLTGYSRAELEGLSVDRILVDAPANTATAGPPRRHVTAEISSEDAWLVTKAGGRISVSVNAESIADAHGAQTRILLVLRDREHLERELRGALAVMEQRLERLRLQLVHAERRATMGTLAIAVGHELGNIGQIQAGAIEQLEVELAKLGASNELRLALADLVFVNGHVTAHARWLMQAGKQAPDQVRAVNLHRLIQDVVAMLAGTGKLRNIEVALALDEQPVFAMVNKTRIEQILINLIVNAADAIAPSKGQILLAVRGESNRHRAEIEVTDTGRGIPPEVMPRIFEPFYTTKREGQGTGLGLAVVLQIVESYGGAIAVKSPPGVGTTVTFDLPLTNER